MLRHFYFKPMGAMGMRGFTLIEIMVAISMLAIVMTSIYGVFSAASLAKQRLDVDSADYHLARVVFDRLGRELQGVYYRPKDQKTLFRGGESPQGEVYLNLTTTAVTPLSRQGTGIARVDYRLTGDEGGSRVLLRSEHEKQKNHATVEASDMMRLAPGIAQMKLRFFNAGRWQSDWDDRQDGLPKLVEVSLVLGHSRERQVPFSTTFELPDVTLQ